VSGARREDLKDLASTIATQAKTKIDKIKDELSGKEVAESQCKEWLEKSKSLEDELGEELADIAENMSQEKHSHFTSDYGQADLLAIDFGTAGGGTSMLGQGLVGIKKDGDNAYSVAYALHFETWTEQANVILVQSECWEPQSLKKYLIYRMTTAMPESIRLCLS
jgi:hypothetical protein